MEQRMSTAREQILYVLWRRQLGVRLGLARSSPPLSGEGLASLVKEAFDEEAVPVADAISELAEGRVLEAHPDGGWVLAAAASAEARRAYAEVVQRGFGRWLLRLEASAAYRALAPIAYGTDFPQYGMTDRAQLDRLAAALAVGHGDEVLDAGCAIGTIAEDIARATGARVHGVDIAVAAIERARERAAGSGQLAYEVANLDEWSPEPGRYAAIMAVDTLYFVEDLPAVVRRLASGLRAGGRLVAFFSSLRPPDAEASVLDPRGSRLGVALTAAGLSFDAIDLTPEEHAFWRRYRDLLRVAEAAFEAEGNARAWRGNLEEAERNVAHAEQGRTTRHLYVARRET